VTPPVNPNLIISDIGYDPQGGTDPFARFTHTVNRAYEISTGYWVSSNHGEQGDVIVDDPNAIAAAGRYHERTPSFMVLGFSQSLANLQICVDQCLSQNKALLIYMYGVPYLDNIASQGLPGLAAYQSHVNQALSIIGTEVPVLWLHEPDGHSSNMSTAQSQWTPSMTIREERYEVLKWGINRLAEFDNISTLVESGLPGFPVPSNYNNASAESAQILTDRFRITEAWKADGIYVGGANFKRASVMHTYAQNIQTRIADLWPVMPYAIESYGIEGDPAKLDFPDPNSQDSWCNPIGPISGVPFFLDPEGGVDGHANCIGFLHATGACASNNTWDPATRSESAGKPGRPHERNVLQRVYASRWYQPTRLYPNHSNVSPGN
jgi:Glycosyl hydrolases family 6